MKWFEGSIPEAIQTAKTNGTVFIVYITGDDEVSKKMTDVWQDTAICELCVSERCVGLTLDAKSESCTQFGQIYPVVCMPCTFFIGNNGVPLEVVGGYLAPRDFYKKIQNAIQMQNAALTEQPTPTGAQPTSAIPGTIEQSAVVDEGVSASTSDEPVKPLEERMEKAKQVLEDKARAKAAKEKEEQKEKEQNRRQQGADLSKFKKAKSEVEADELKRERIKERQEQKAAQDRVRKQIAEDKAERLARSQGRLQEAAGRPDSGTKPTVTPAAPVTDPNRMQKARIQFRLPDGSAVTHQFPSSNFLSEARDFIQPHAAPLGPFSLSTTYPKRVFSEANMAETLLDLNLAPSAIVIVLPGGTRPTTVRQVTGGGGSNFLMMLLSPFMTVWGYFCTFIFGQPQANNSANNSGDDEGRQDEPNNRDRPEASSSSRRVRPKTGDGRRRRQEGNIHRLQDDSDDERVTWNGNSTQQM